MKDLALLMAAKPKDKGAAVDEAAAPASEPGGDFKSLISESAKAGDWDAFADAVAGYVRSCSMKKE